MTNCIFCKIIAGESPGQVLYQDEHVTAFRDAHPVAPTHVLVVPNKHIASVNDLTTQDETLEGIDRSGYRIIANTGPNAGQLVYHLHLHLIGGQRMHFPMG
jgi:histidine triad (HIT) family protein